LEVVALRDKGEPGLEDTEGSSLEDRDADSVPGVALVKFDNGNAAIKAPVYAGPNSILKGRANDHLESLFSLSRRMKFDGLVSHKRLLEGLRKRGVTCLLSFLMSSPP